MPTKREFADTVVRAELSGIKSFYFSNVYCHSLHHSLDINKKSISYELNDNSSHVKMNYRNNTNPFALRFR